MASQFEMVTTETRLMQFAGMTHKSWGPKAIRAQLGDISRLWRQKLFIFRV